MKVSRKKRDLIDRLVSKGILKFKTDEGQGGGSNGEGTDGNANGGEGDDNGEDGEKKGDGIDDKTAQLLKDVMKQKARAKEAQAQLDATKTELEALRQALGGLKPEDIATIVNERAEADRIAREKRGEYDSIVAQMREAHEQTVSELNSKITELQTQYTSKLAEIEEMTVGRAFSESQFVLNESMLTPRISRKEFGEFFDVVDGQVVGFNKPRGAEGRAQLVDANGQPKSFDEALRALYEKHPDAKSLIKAKAKPGAGSGDGESGGKPSGKAADDTEQLSGRELIKRGLDSRR